MQLWHVASSSGEGGVHAQFQRKFHFFQPFCLLASILGDHLPQHFYLLFVLFHCFLQVVPLDTFLDAVCFVLLKLLLPPQQDVLLDVQVLQLDRIALDFLLEVANQMFKLVQHLS